MGNASSILRSRSAGAAVPGAPLGFVGLLVVGAWMATHPVVARGDQTLAVSFHEDRVVAGVEAEPFSPFVFYLLGENLDASVEAFEMSVSVPPSLVVLTRKLADGWIDGGSSDNFIVRALVCLDASSPYPFVRYEAGIFTQDVPRDVTVCFGAAEPSSLTPPAPSVTRCGSAPEPMVARCSGQATPYPAECGVVNPTAGVIEDPCTIPVERTSWGAVKASYADDASD